MMRRVTILFDGDGEGKSVLSQFIWEMLSAYGAPIAEDNGDTLVVAWPNGRSLDEFRKQV
jgi:5S rRNA maturation endonuclease (ribonuclease M5)